MKGSIIIFILFANLVLAQTPGALVLAPGDKTPEYPGGILTAFKFISKTMVYPKDAIDAGAEGYVIVRFAIDSTGKVNSPSIGQTSGWSSLDQEAIRLISKMPNWSPAEQNHRKVSVYFNMPIVFSLHDAPNEVKQKQISLSNTYFSNGLKDVELKKYEDAKRNFKKAYSLNIANVDALYNLSAMYHATNMRDSACIVWNQLKYTYNKDVTEYLNKYCNN